MLSAESGGESRRGRQQEGTRSDFPYKKTAFRAAVGRMAWEGSVGREGKKPRASAPIHARAGSGLNQKLHGCIFVMIGRWNPEAWMFSLRLEWCNDSQLLTKQTAILPLLTWPDWNSTSQFSNLGSESKKQKGAVWENETAGDDFQYWCFSLPSL